MSIADRAAAWWSAWKYVAVLALLLLASVVGNVLLLRKTAAAGAECRAKMVEAAGKAIAKERERAAKAERRAAEIAADIKADTMRATARAQENTHARESDLRQVPVAGACIMPAGGMPGIQRAIDEANAAAGD